MTRAIILAAGQGTRLRPLTDTMPKCLVSFQGKPLLDWQAGTLKQCGIDHIHVVGGYRADQIEHHGYACSVNEKYASTNMVETLFSAVEYLLGSDDIIISYGDIIFEEANLLAVLACQDPIAVMCDTQWKDYWSLRFDDPLSDAETLKCDHQGYITELGKRANDYQDIQAQYTGLIKVRADKIPALIEFYQSLDRDSLYDGTSFNNMYMTSFLQALIHAGWKVKAIPVSNGWLEVDSVRDLNIYEKLADEGLLSPFYQIG